MSSIVNLLGIAGAGLSGYALGSHFSRKTAVQYATAAVAGSVAYNYLRPKVNEDRSLGGNILAGAMWGIGFSALASAGAIGLMPKSSGKSLLTKIFGESVQQGLGAKMNIPKEWYSTQAGGLGWMGSLGMHTPHAGKFYQYFSGAPNTANLVLNEGKFVGDIAKEKLQKAILADTTGSTIGGALIGAAGGMLYSASGLYSPKHDRPQPIFNSGGGYTYGSVGSNQAINPL